VFLLAPLSIAVAGTFTVKITPTGSGQVLWTTTDPTAGGTISGSGGSFTYTVNSSDVVMTFVPNPGGSIVKVMTNEGDDTAWVLSHNNTDEWPGPGENSKKVAVIFSGGTTPPVIGPTGAFGFSFPTNNPSLTAITDITGNYAGVTPYSHHRNYNVDVAQDESGKLTAMGTVSGITNAAGNNQLAGSIGAITTVNNQPTAQLKGKFDGTVDGKVVTASGSGQGPVAVSNIGGGTNGVTGTGSGSAKANGVPYPVKKNIPIKLPAPDAASHIRKSWSIELTITNTAPASGKSSIMASALLTLPNGDQISFPAKKTKYSAKTGYALSFKGGTNTTIVPNAVDKKTAVSIKGMTLVETNTVWKTTAGTMSYQFLGQKGTGNLMDFLGP
jgi:hypothetical protein